MRNFRKKRKKIFYRKILSVPHETHEMMDLVWYLEFETILWQLKLLEIARNRVLILNTSVEFEYGGYVLGYGIRQLFYQIHSGLVLRRRA